MHSQGTPLTRRAAAAQVTKEGELLTAGLPQYGQARAMRCLRCRGATHF